jgi:hypothetical protein
VTRSSGQQVVVVDGVPETAQVLRAVLEPRGHRVERVRGFDPSASPTAPGTVLVLHDDGASESARRRKYGTVPRVIIGSLKSGSAADAHGTEQRLAQPFQYAELIRAVESLLAGDEAHRSAA